MPTNSTPLWLQLKKEYIDDNFEQLLPYLKDNAGRRSDDAFYDTTVQLLRDRAAELVCQLGTRPLFDKPETTEVLTFHVRLLAAYLLLGDQTPLALSAYIAMVSELKLLLPKFSDELLQKLTERLKCLAITNQGFTWQDIIDFKQELFTYSLIHNSRFYGEIKEPLLYEKYGTAMLTSQGLYLTCEPGTKAKTLLVTGSNSLDTNMGVSLRTPSGEKLKQADEKSLPKMDEYLKDFIYQLWQTQKKVQKVVKPAHGVGDEVTLRITRIDSDGTIHVETVGDKYDPMEGTIRFSRPNTLYYNTTLFAKHLRLGDYLKGKVTNTAKGYFDIEEAFIRFVVEDCRTQIGYEETMARLICKNANSLVWINGIGTPLYSRLNDAYQVGSHAILRISEYGVGERYGAINTEIVERVDPGNEPIEQSEMQALTIEAFADSAKVPEVEEKKKENGLSPDVLRLLTHLFYEHQRTLLKPSERFCLLANARVMAEMTGDDLAASYIKFSSTYLRVLVQFVNNESVADITLAPEPDYEDAYDTLVRLAIVQLLKEYGKRENSDVLAGAISEYEESFPMIARLARLIQMANSMHGTLSEASINVIKREIIRTLSLETESDTDLEADTGTYLGMESGTVEFKTSFVYPSSNNMQPNQTEQEVNVFRGICAFLNSSTGGTLYLGVNDQGYITGVENDMKFLRKFTMDDYIRYIQDRAKHYFDVDGIVYLRIEPLYDNQVVAIHVEPHPYRVVELNGTAYLRINAESRIMPEKLRLEMVAQKVFKDKDKAAAISRLQHACSQKKCVILHNYSSSNSGTMKDRYVEAYEVHPDDNLVMCYDRNTASAEKLKVFNISRIGWVEVLDEDWQFPSSHKKIEVDAFHMSGTKPISVSLQLDMMAKNLLVEEYPASEKDLVADKKDPSTWYYNAKVYSIYGIGRFYAGLANHITILDCPELKAYVEEYKKHL